MRDGFAPGLFFHTEEALCTDAPPGPLLNVHHHPAGDKAASGAPHRAVGIAEGLIVATTGVPRADGTVVATVGATTVTVTGAALAGAATVVTPADVAMDARRAAAMVVVTISATVAEVTVAEMIAAEMIAAEMVAAEMVAAEMVVAEMVVAEMVVAEMVVAEMTAVEMTAAERKAAGTREAAGRRSTAGGSKIASKLGYKMHPWPSSPAHWRSSTGLASCVIPNKATVSRKRTHSSPRV